MMAACRQPHRQLTTTSSSRLASNMLASSSIRHSSGSSSIRPRRQQRQCTAPAAAADEHAAANALLAAANAPVRAAFPLAVRAATVPGGYRGLVATRDLQEGDVALAVPLANALAVPNTGTGGAAAAAAAALVEPWQTAHGIKLPEALSEFLCSEAEWDARLTAWLFWLLRSQQQEGHGGGGSGDSEPCLWDLYASALPRADECAGFCDFADEEAEAWLPYARWRERQQDAAAARAKAVQIVLDALGGSGAGAGTGDATGAAAWAYSLVRSRTFGRRLDGGSDAITNLMVPGADLLNHSLWPNARFAVVAPPGDAQGAPPPLLAVVAARDIAAGDEATITYGADRPNESLLGSYGFVLAGNPNDARALPPPAVAAEGRRRCASPRTAVPLHGADGSALSLPAVAEWHLTASPDEIVAANPSLRHAPAWWRRRSALMALALVPRAGDDASGGSVGPNAVGSADASSLVLSLSAYRQMQRLVAKAEARIADDEQRGWGSPARRAAATAAVCEEALLLAEIVDACESELEALGVSVQ